MKTKKITHTEKQKKNNSEFKRQPPTLNNENYPKIQNKPSKSTTINHQTLSSSYNITVIPKTPIEELEHFAMTNL